MIIGKKRRGTRGQCNSNLSLARFSHVHLGLAAVEKGRERGKLKEKGKGRGVNKPRTTHQFGSRINDVSQGWGEKKKGVKRCRDRPQKGRGWRKEEGGVWWCLNPVSRFWGRPRK